MECIDRSAACTAAAAIGRAAFPMAKIQMRRERSRFNSSIARVVAGPGAAAAMAPSYNSNNSSGPTRTGVATSPALMRGTRRLQRCRHEPGKLRIRVGGEDVEAHHTAGDVSIRSHDEHVARVELAVGGTVLFCDCLIGIAGEQVRKSGLTRPIGLGGIGVDADADHDHLFPVVEERGVLITVRLHLNRSATCSRFWEKREYHGLASIVAELDR